MTGEFTVIAPVRWVTSEFSVSGPESRGFPERDFWPRITSDSPIICPESMPIAKITYYSLTYQDKSGMMRWPDSTMGSRRANAASVLSISSPHRLKQFLRIVADPILEDDLYVLYIRDLF
jgi:hypothetical protein